MQISMLVIIKVARTISSIPEIFLKEYFSDMLTESSTAINLQCVLIEHYLKGNKQLV